MMQKNSIFSSRFELFFSKWVTRKLPIISRYVDVFMLHIFYILNVIMAIGKLVIFLSFVILCISSMNQR